MEMSENSYSDQIIAFLEGDLDYKQEEALFVVLSSDTVLRNEMKEYVSIQSFVKYDSDTMMPSASMRDKVMNSLPLTKIPIKSATAGGFGALFLKSYKYILTSMCTFVFAYFLFDSANQDYLDAVPEYSAKASSENTINKMTDNEVPHLVSTEETVIDQKQQTTAKSSAFKQNNTTSELSDNINLLNNDNNNSIAEIYETEIHHLSIFTSDINFNTKLYEDNYHDPSLFKPLYVLFEDEAIKNITISYRGMNSKSYRHSNAQNDDEPFNHDISLGIHYKYNNMLLGLEFGNEEFVQEFELINDEGKLRVTQKPNMSWLGISYQQNFQDIIPEETLQPFTKLIFGAAENGAIGKAILGLEYQPGSNVVFSLGLEGTLLAFKYSGDYFSTEKLGITYGFRVHY